MANSTINNAKEINTLKCIIKSQKKNIKYLTYYLYFMFIIVNVSAILNMYIHRITIQENLCVLYDHCKNIYNSFVDKIQDKACLLVAKALYNLKNELSFIITFMKNIWYNSTDYTTNIVSKVNDKSICFMMNFKKLLNTMFNMFEKKLLDLSNMTNTITNMVNNTIERNVVNVISHVNKISKLCMITIIQHLTFVQHFIIKHFMYWYNTVILVYLIQILN